MARFHRNATAPATADDLLRRFAAVAEAPGERGKQVGGGFRDDSAGREDRLGTGLLEWRVVLRRHHAADHNHNVTSALLLKFCLKFRNQGQVRGGERGYAED